MSLILDALRKAQSERKTIFVTPEKKRAINVGKPRRFFYYILAGAICLAFIIFIMPLPKPRPVQSPQVALKKDIPPPSKKVSDSEVAKKSRQALSIPLSQDTRSIKGDKVKTTKETQEARETLGTVPTRAKDRIKDAEKIPQEPAQIHEDTRVVIKRNDEDRISKMYNTAVEESSRGNMEAAKKIYLKILEEKPDYIEVLNNLGVIAMKEGSAKDALSYYQKILNKHPDYAKAYNNMAIIHMREGNKKLAEEYLKKAIEMDKEGMEAYINLSALLRSEGRLNEAKKLLEPLVKKGGTEPSLYLSYALIKDEMGDAKEAVLYYRQYLLYSPVRSGERSKVLERLKFLEDRDFTKSP
ncbi:MAG TPA: tetratricopeptide repeat protein [Syntrophorhabdaceae bacterium]|nr:tetratricopeptide repeat protein [Syntrophorhabdaceae bacterium]